MSLDNYTVEQLKEEIKHREVLQSCPDHKVLPNWGPVKSLAIQATRSLAADESIKDIEQYIFEAVMEAVYGPKIWDWWNPLLR